MVGWPVRTFWNYFLASQFIFFLTKKKLFCETSSTNLMSAFYGCGCITQVYDYALLTQLSNRSACWLGKMGGKKVLTQTMGVSPQGGIILTSQSSWATQTLWWTRVTHASHFLMFFLFPLKI